jgi:hypothetical protein
VRLRIYKEIWTVFTEPADQRRLLAPSEAIERPNPALLDQPFSHALQGVSRSLLMCGCDDQIESLGHLMITHPIPPDSVRQEGCFTLGRADWSGAAGSPLDDDGLGKKTARLHPDE